MELHIVNICQICVAFTVVLLWIVIVYAATDLQQIFHDYPSLTEVGVAGIFFSSGTDLAPILQMPFVTSQVYSCGQQWIESSQQMAF